MRASRIVLLPVLPFAQGTTDEAVTKRSVSLPPDRADVNLVAVAEHDLSRHRLLADLRSILATEILKHRVALTDHDVCVMTGDAGTSRKIVAAGSRPMTFSPALNATRRPPVTIQRLTAGGRDTARSIEAANAYPTPCAVLMMGAEPSRSSSARRSSFHEADERRVGDECSRPEPFVDLVFPHHARRLVDKKRQEVEGVRRQMNLIAVARELPAVRIERERPESRGHNQSSDFPRFSPAPPPT